jgi:hypothetical protein
MWSEPLVRLPERVCFSLRDTGRILLTVDVAVDATPAQSDDGRRARAIRALITKRLWPELGRLLSQDEEA